MKPGLTKACDNVSSEMLICMVNDSLKIVTHLTTFSAGYVYQVIDSGMCCPKSNTSKGGACMKVVLHMRVSLHIGHVDPNDIMKLSRHNWMSMPCHLKKTSSQGKICHWS